MREARVARATEGEWGQLAKSCADQLGDFGSGSGNGEGGEVLGILYATDLLAGDLSSILTFLRERTGIPDWIGTVGLGICVTGQEFFDQPAVVAMALPLPGGSLRVTENLRDAEDSGRLESALRGMHPGIGLVHGDPRNLDVPGLIARISDDASCFLVGGLSASRMGFPQIADHIVDGGVSGVFIDASVPVVTGLSQGCIPIGPPRSIDACEADVLTELAGAPPQDALEADLGVTVEDEDFAEAMADVHVALMVPGSDTGDYLVRNLTGLDPNTGWIAMDTNPSPGERLMFCRRNAEAAERDLKRMVTDLAARAGVPPRAGLYHSCVARGPNLFGSDARELEIILEALGDFPLVGFFGGGEISHNRVYGYTGVLTLFL